MGDTVGLQQQPALPGSQDLSTAMRSSLTGLQGTLCLGVGLWGIGREQQGGRTRDCCKRRRASEIRAEEVGRRGDG